MSPNCIIRPMTAADIDAVAALEAVCFRTPWSKRALCDELKNSIAHYLVAVDGGALAAYAGMWIILDEAHITNVAVAPAYRRLGLGRRIMLCMMNQALLHGAEQMTLEVRESNYGAKALYAMLDFEKNGERKGYYFDTGEAAHIMWNRDIAKTIKSNDGPRPPRKIKEDKKMKNIVSSINAPAAIGPYSHAIEAGSFIFTSGQLGLDPASGKLADGVEAQTRQAIANLTAVLEAAGTSLASVVKTTVFVKDLADFSKVNAIYGEFFGPAFPARSCVQVAALPAGGLVEIEVVALKG